jgi:hypothetical protein
MNGLGSGIARGLRVLNYDIKQLGIPGVECGALKSFLWRTIEENRNWNQILAASEPFKQYYTIWIGILSRLLNNRKDTHTRPFLYKTLDAILSKPEHLKLSESLVSFGNDSQLFMFIFQYWDTPQYPHHPCHERFLRMLDYISQPQNEYFYLLTEPTFMSKLFHQGLRREPLWSIVAGDMIDAPSWYLIEDKLLSTWTEIFMTGDDHPLYMKYNWNAYLPRLGSFFMQAKTNIYAFTRETSLVLEQISNIPKPIVAFIAAYNVNPYLFVYEKWVKYWFDSNVVKRGLYARGGLSARGRERMDLFRQIDNILHAESIVDKRPRWKDTDFLWRRQDLLQGSDAFVCAAHVCKLIDEASTKGRNGISKSVEHFLSHCNL